LPPAEKVAIGLGEQSRELPRLESMKNVAKIRCSDLVVVAVGDRQPVEFAGRLGRETRAIYSI
jgi:hypothetical protein